VGLDRDVELGHGMLTWSIRSGIDHASWAWCTSKCPFNARARSGIFFRIRPLAAVDNLIEASSSISSSRTISRVRDEWTGEPSNYAPEEHDALAWLTDKELHGLRLADPRLPQLVRVALQGMH
jgi:hypothetical protein